MHDPRMSEEQMVGLVRNALLVAGHEMGAKGDHWPVVNSTIYSLMKDWEQLKIERNVHEEMRKHIYAQLDDMDRILLTCEEDVQIDTAPKMKELREIYDAYFEAVDLKKNPRDDIELPAHVKRAQTIIRTLED